MTSKCGTAARRLQTSLMKSPRFEFQHSLDVPSPMDALGTRADCTTGPTNTGSVGTRTCTGASDSILRTVMTVVVVVAAVARTADGRTAAVLVVVVEEAAAAAGAEAGGSS
jgi:hypothetical protein